MIVYRTTMEKIPDKCIDCKMICRLPAYRGDLSRIQKKYLTMRHKDCPLMEIKEYEK